MFQARARQSTFNYSVYSYVSVYVYVTAGPRQATETDKREPTLGDEVGEGLFLQGP